MLIRLGVWWRSLWTMIAVTVRRVIQGRRHPGWTWTHEVIATGMKAEFARLAKLPWDVQRNTWKAIALPAFTVRGVRFEATRLGGLEALWLTPNGIEGGKVILYLHGGAYHFGSIEEYLDYAARLARGAGARALLVAYRLAPEHPFPAAFDDALAVYQALLASGVAASQVVIAGDSAGGGLTAALLVALRDRGLPLPKGAVLVSPWIDLAARGGSMETLQAYDFFEPMLVDGWAKSVLAGADAKDPRISATYAALAGLPPMLVQVGGAEMLLDQDAAFVEKARAAGVDARLSVFDGCFHDWPLFAAVLGDGQRAVDEAAAFIRGM